jgi:hypothetical protein
MSSPRPISPRKAVARRPLPPPINSSKVHHLALSSPVCKRRRLGPASSFNDADKSSRNIEEEEELESLMRLYKMAQETVSYCEGRLKKLSSNKNSGSNKKARGLPLPLDHRLDNIDNIHPLIALHEDVVEEEKIGGIPKKFLDLSHFPQFNVKATTFTKECLDTAHVIADENAFPLNSGTTIGSYSSPLFGKRNSRSRSTSPTNNKKLPSNRITVHSAPLPHVNGTYIQEGVFGDSPLFVRVGPPRKFMGFDCCVVLRREVVGAGSDENQSSDKTGNDGVKTWKIGLVPSHTITHPRLIGYYEGVETLEGEPPVEGWKVPGSVKKVGGLRIMYEE